MPVSEWEPPDLNNLPDLRKSTYVGVDTETRDDSLLELGSGMRTRAKTSYPIGVSLSDGDYKVYLPLRHPQDNVDHNQAVNYIRDMVSNPMQCKVFHNSVYDLGVLQRLGITVKGPVLDTMTTQTLLDEEFKAGYSLDAVANHWTGHQKNEALMIEAAAAMSISPLEVKSNIWRLDPKYVGPYAEEDAWLPVKIMEKQWPEIQRQELEAVFWLESANLPLAHKMHWQGIRVDEARARQLGSLWKCEETKLLRMLKKETSLSVDVDSPTSLVALCEYLDIPHESTARGNPSFTASWLEGHGHPLIRAVVQIRQFRKMRRDFIDGQILRYIHDGRIHPHYKTTKRDTGGTRSGRYSSANPNEQQVPARNPEFGPQIRALRLPESDEEWLSLDYSGQEVRLMVEVAAQLGYPSALAMRDRYLEDPDLDFHREVADDINLPRGPVKGVVFTKSYGGGIPKLASEIGCDLNEAQDISDRVHARAPFIEGVFRKAMDLASKRGYVKTLLGRRSRFNEYNEQGYRMYTHKGLNRVIQGTGADMIKRAMVEVYKELGHVPLSSVHDENNYSGDRAEGERIKVIMEGCMSDLMKIPIKVDLGVGPNWGEAKK